MQRPIPPPPSTPPPGSPESPAQDRRFRAEILHAPSHTYAGDVLIHAHDKDSPLADGYGELLQGSQRVRGRFKEGDPEGCVELSSTLEAQYSFVLFKEGLPQPGKAPPELHSECDAAVQKAIQAAADARMRGSLMDSIVRPAAAVWTDSPESQPWSGAIKESVRLSSAPLPDPTAQVSARTPAPQRARSGRGASDPRVGLWGVVLVLAASVVFGLYTAWRSRDRKNKKAKGPSRPPRTLRQGTAAPPPPPSDSLALFPGLESRIRGLGLALTHLAVRIARTLLTSMTQRKAKALALWAASQRQDASPGAKGKGQRRSVSPALSTASSRDSRGEGPAPVATPPAPKPQNKSPASGRRAAAAQAPKSNNANGASPPLARGRTRSPARSSPLQPPSFEPHVNGHGARGKSARHKSPSPVRDVRPGSSPFFSARTTPAHTRPSSPSREEAQTGDAGGLGAVRRVRLPAPSLASPEPEPVKAPAHEPSPPVAAALSHLLEASSSSDSRENGNGPSVSLDSSVASEQQPKARVVPSTSPRSLDGKVDREKGDQVADKPSAAPPKSVPGTPPRAPKPAPAPSQLLPDPATPPQAPSNPRCRSLSQTLAAMPAVQPRFSRRSLPGSSACSSADHSPSNSTAGASALNLTNGSVPLGRTESLSLTHPEPQPLERASTLSKGQGKPPPARTLSSSRGGPGSNPLQRQLSCVGLPRAPDASEPSSCNGQGDREPLDRARLGSCTLSSLSYASVASSGADSTPALARKLSAAAKPFEPPSATGSSPDFSAEAEHSEHFRGPHPLPRGLPPPPPPPPHPIYCSPGPWPFPFVSPPHGMQAFLLGPDGAPIPIGFPPPAPPAYTIDPETNQPVFLLPNGHPFERAYPVPYPAGFLPPPGYFQPEKPSPNAKGRPVQQMRGPDAEILFASDGALQPVVVTGTPILTPGPAPPPVRSNSRQASEGSAGQEAEQGEAQAERGVSRDREAREGDAAAGAAPSTSEPGSSSSRSSSSSEGEAPSPTDSAPESEAVPSPTDSEPEQAQDEGGQPSGPSSGSSIPTSEAPAPSAPGPSSSFPPHFPYPWGLAPAPVTFVPLSTGGSVPAICVLGTTVRDPDSSDEGQVEEESESEGSTVSEEDPWYRAHCLDRSSSRLPPARTTSTTHPDSPPRAPIPTPDSSFRSPEAALVQTRARIESARKNYESAPKGSPERLKAARELESAEEDLADVCREFEKSTV